MAKASTPIKLKKTPAAKAVKVVSKVPAAQVTRSYLSQEDVPSCSLTEALRVGVALIDQYGGHAASPLDVAAALDLQPSTGFRMLCGASIAYGITAGGYNAQKIALTPLGKRILAPVVEGDDLVAKREAVLRPRILREFLSKYSGAAFPREDIAINVLKSMSVPADRASAVLSLILDSAKEVGFLRTIKDKRYVDLGGGPMPDGEANTHAINVVKEGSDEDSSVEGAVSQTETGGHNSSVLPAVVEAASVNRRVFITHGKNMAFIEPNKKLLGFGELVPVVSVEKQSVSQPVPDKVMNDMRTCSAAIIHVDSEQTLIDKDAKEHSVINPNVLIEIGAAMALFGRRFILLVRDGVKLPSNLQGLYEVRYQGESLDGNATIRLLEAINDIKNNPLPSPSGVQN